jgi:hypothetical protein
MGPKVIGLISGFWGIRVARCVGSLRAPDSPFWHPVGLADFLGVIAYNYRAVVRR